MKMDSTLLHYDDTTILKILVLAGADTTVGEQGRTTPLMKAVMREDLGLIEALLEADRMTLKDRNVHGQTALIIATRFSEVSVIKLLLKYVDEEDLTAIDMRGETALFSAVYRKEKEIVKLLLEADIKRLTPTMPNKLKYTPVIVARDFKDKEIFLALTNKKCLTSP